MAPIRSASVRRRSSAGPRRPDSTSVDTLLTIEAMNERRDERAGVYHTGPGLLWG